MRNNFWKALRISCIVVLYISLRLQLPYCTCNMYSWCPPFHANGKLCIQRRIPSVTYSLSPAMVGENTLTRCLCHDVWLDFQYGAVCPIHIIQIYRWGMWSFANYVTHIHYVIGDVTVRLNIALHIHVYMRVALEASSKIVISSINARYHDKKLSRPHIKGQDHGVTRQLSHLNGCNSFKNWRKFAVILWAPTKSFKSIWRVAMAKDNGRDVSTAPQ